MFWENRHDKAIDGFEAYLAYFQARLSGFMDDLIAIARCAGKSEILALSSQQAAELKQKMRKEADVDTRSIKEILAILRGHAEHFRGVLGTKK